MPSIPIKSLALFILVFISFMLAQPAAAQGAGDDEAIGDLFGMFFSFIVFPILLLIHKSILVRRVKKSMRKISKDVESEEPSVLEKPEHPALAQPQILEFDVTDELPAAIEHREALISQALKDLKSRWRSGFLACVVYLTLPALLGFIGREKFQEMWWIVVVFVAIYFVLISASYLVYRSGYRPKDASFGFEAPQVKLIGMIIKALLNPRLDFVLWFVLGGILILSTYYTEGEDTALNTIPLFFIGICIAVAFHFLLLVRRWRAPIEGPSVNLLVLRVFGSSKSAVLTFDRLIRFWRRFGLHFTIDDPDYAGHRYRFFQFRTLAQFLVLTILAMANILLGVGVFAVMVGYDWYGMIKRRPVQDQEQAHRRIQKTLARPRYTDGSFKDLRMVAFKNTWKLVVDEFVKVADVVLFDLREYSDQREGSQYEVDFLFDTYPANRIVFLRNADSDKEAIHRMILGRWRELREGSPNTNIPDPVIRIYVSDKQKGEDVQGLMDLLLSAAM